MNGRGLLLASGSPRRQKLMADAGFEFETIVPSIEERSDVDLTVRELTAWNAWRKGGWATTRYPSKTVLAADTLVAIDGVILGKPANVEEAAKMLHRLSGRIHEVCTAVFIGSPGSKKPISFTEISRVRFRRLTAAKIADYFSKVNPLDKAGAYAAQGHGTEIILKVTGSFSNVVGLPMEKTVDALRILGIRPQPD